MSKAEIIGWANESLARFEYGSDDYKNLSALILMADLSPAGGGEALEAVQWIVSALAEERYEEICQSRYLADVLTAAALTRQPVEVGVEEFLRVFDYFAYVDEGGAFARNDPAYRISTIKEAVSKFIITRKD